MRKIFVIVFLTLALFSKANAQDLQTYITAQSTAAIQAGDNLQCLVTGARDDNGVYMACWQGAVSNVTAYLSGWSVAALYPGDSVACNVRGVDDYNLLFMSCVITGGVVAGGQQTKTVFLPLVMR